MKDKIWCACKLSLLENVLSNQFQNSSIRVDIYSGWTDDLSGLAMFNCSVYLMAPNSEGLLQNTGDPVLIINRNLLESEFDLVEFTVSKPGRYSVEMRAIDRAGNARRARTFLLFDDSQTTKRNNSKSVTTKNAVFRYIKHPLTHHCIYIIECYLLLNVGL